MFIGDIAVEIHNARNQDSRNVGAHGILSRNRKTVGYSTTKEDGKSTVNCNARNRAAQISCVDIPNLAENRSVMLL